MEIEFSETARIQISDTIEYISVSFGLSVARKVVRRLYHDISLLRDFPRLAMPYANINGVVFRRLVVGLSSVLYYERGDVIVISLVIDARMSPARIAQMLQEAVAR